jgi:hypothetical protein
MPEDEAWPDLPVGTELAWEQCDAVEDGLRTGVGGVGGAGVEELLAAVGRDWRDAAAPNCCGRRAGDP